MNIVGIETDRTTGGMTIPRMVLRVLSAFFLYIGKEESTMEKGSEKDGILCNEHDLENKACTAQNKHKNKNKEAIDMIIKSIEQLQYGTITITIHNGSIVQVETNTKQRFG